MFPFGTPSEEELEEMWDSQKCEKANALDSDNLLDYYEVWG